MTSETRLLVQESWAAVLESAPAAAEAFYRRLLDIDPQLGRFFRDADMGQQGRMLMQAVTGIRGRPGEAPRDTLPAPGSAGDPWESAHQMVVAGAFFSMLDRVLGPRFVPPLRSAWMEMFSAHGAEIHHAALGHAGIARMVPPLRGRLVEIGG